MLKWVIVALGYDPLWSSFVLLLDVFFNIKCLLNRLPYSTASECLDAALNTLSRALEDNRDNAEIWCHYLSLFVRRGKREEVQEMYETAVEHAPDYQVWWSVSSVAQPPHRQFYLKHLSAL